MTFFLMSVPNVKVVSAMSGESIAVFEKEELADALVKAFEAPLGTADWQHTRFQFPVPPRQL